MFATFASFELRSWLRSPMPWIFMFLFGLLCFAATVSDQMTIGGSFGNVHKNAPFVAQNWYGVFSLLALLLVTAFLNTAAIRDYERQMSQIIFSKPIGKAGYYFGHFLGAFLICIIPMLGVSLGMWAGVAANSAFGWLPENRFGPFEMQGHLMGLLLIVIPNLIFSGGILYAVAVNTRSTLYSFIAAAALLVGYIIAGNLLQDIKNETLGSLLDPFGFRAFSIATKYWTVEDKNTMALGFEGTVLLNRLLWMAVGIAALLIGYWRFDFSEKKSGSKKQKAAAKEEDLYGLKTLGAIPAVAPESGKMVAIRQFFSQFKTELRGMVRSTAFILLALLALLNCLPNLLYANESYGTHELPVTYTMINLIRGSFYLFTIIIMVYFSGAIIWKERTHGMSDITDALPTKNWTLWLGKYAAVLGLMFIMQVIVLLAAIGAQAALGYTRFEVGTYVRELLVMDMLGFAFTLALSFLVHALSPNMYLGFFIVVILLIANAFAWSTIKMESNMVQFGGTPSYILSDFYGYQPYLSTLFWFHGYWLLFCGLLALATILLWPRGRMGSLRERFRNAKLEWRNYRWFGIGTLALWLVFGAWTYYNTQVLNPYYNSGQIEKFQYQYEAFYKKYENRVQPRVYDVKYDIDLRPEVRSVVVNGVFKARNIYKTNIDTLFVNVPQHGDFTLENPRLKLLLDDSTHNFRLYRFEPAMAPGDSLTLNFTTSFVPKGFENQVEWARVVQNGTFFDNTDIMPIFGYQEQNELGDKNTRKRFGLPEKTRRPALNRQDTLHRMDAYIGLNSDWVNVETIIRTAPDQIALGPGSLLREWNENGRRCFHYKLDHASFNFYSFLSARYEVARRMWNGVSMEVYYHKDHHQNVERMLTAIEKSLEYFTKNFGPYYHKQCRIVEFPRFSEFAQSFPGTMPYSEGVGFIQDFKDPDKDIDMMFYVAAHEIGHQYWGHQECGAAMQGGEMLVETFAQWSALMVMEHAYGRDQMRKFLSYEMDRYLRGRGRESERELPLARCEGQGYIHYNKGSVQMYHLKELIGEERVNAALRAFLEKYRYAQPPYPVSLDALDEFYAQTPDSLDYVVKDLFEEITLFENRCREASVKDLGNGQWEVKIKVEAAKFKSDEVGKQTEAPLNDYIEIGAFAAPESGKTYGKTLYRQRVKITQPEQWFTFVVQEKPEKAGVDPFSLIVDRNPEDNMKDLE
ncbi:MAG: ABC transporter permease [Chitinophagales bacterium]|nr:ABC transporter permease [Chitinophagales bacterium]